MLKVAYFSLIVAYKYLMLLIIHNSRSGYLPYGRDSVLLFKTGSLAKIHKKVH